jgi:hypothetical protein
MARLTKYIGSFCLAAAMLAPVISTGCAGHVRYYDGYYGDYHTWGPGEDVYYRQWLAERHYQYRDFHRWDEAHQRDYWQWRHGHDHDHH